MKKLSVIIAFLMLATSFGLYSCSNDKFETSSSNFNSTTETLSPNFDGMEIKNFSSYKALGAATVTTDTVTVATSETKLGGRIIAAAEETALECKLVGVTEDGAVEEVEFESEDGETETQEWTLTGFGAHENFTFIEYYPENLKEINLERFSESIIGTSFYWDEDKEDYVFSMSEKIYILDNVSGKIFDFEHIFQKLLADNHKKIFDISCNHYVEGEGGSFIEIHCKSLNEDSWMREEQYSGFYRIYIEDENFALEKVLSEDKMIDFFGDSLSKDRTLEIPYAYVDKYGNLYSNINYSGVSYILKRDGSIDKVVDTWGILFKALDGIMYCVKINESFAPDGTYIRSEEGKCFNAEGNLVDSKYIPPQEYVSPPDFREIYGEKFLTLGNVDYYFGYQITKFIFADDGTFLREDVVLEDRTEYSVFANRKLYFYSDNSLFYCDIDTGEKTELANNYRFKTLTAGWSNKSILRA